VKLSGEGKTEVGLEEGRGATSIRAQIDSERVYIPRIRPLLLPIGY
jgi:hypothetical protein